ncbi:IS4 family transposase (plasmid) [Embleya sp. NBC_00888]|uniref:IS4 family transposase n=1 Tax=Embleya sp. NBC_00888 TaxID=2975960 RepID=UPI002F918566|nr:IS4 family transposase [Embleya sp. NBC_00888]
MSRAARAFAPAHPGELTGILPAEVVDEVLELTRRQERRVRLLPARVVVYFVLAMAMFPGQGYRGVWAGLAAGLDDSVPFFPSARALRLARGRLGTEPMAELFRRICGTVSGTTTHGVWWRGLRVVAWDGTGIGVAASAANTRFYGLPTGGRGPSGYPQVRLVAMVDCGTRALMDAVWAPRATGETVLAARLVRSLRAGMLLLADRGFDGYELWGEVLSGGADLLWRVNGRRLLTPLCEFPDGSYTALLPERGDQRRRNTYRSRGKTLPGEPIGHRVGVIEYDITVSTSDGDMRTEHIRLVTTLRDARVYPADELAELYHRRWEIETAYFSLKVSLRGARTVLRSHVPEGVDQDSTDS